MFSKDTPKSALPNRPEDTLKYLGSLHKVLTSIQRLNLKETYRDMLLPKTLNNLPERNMKEMFIIEYKQSPKEKQTWGRKKEKCKHNLEKISKREKPPTRNNKMRGLYIIYEKSSILS